MGNDHIAARLFKGDSTQTGLVTATERAGYPDKIDLDVNDRLVLDKLDEILTLFQTSGFVWTKTTGLTVSASSSAVIDTNLISTFSRIDYIINFKKVSDSSTKSMHLVVQNNAGTITNSISERMAGPIDLVLDTSDDGTDAFIDVTNNETSDLTVTFLRAITP